MRVSRSLIERLIWWNMLHIWDLSIFVYVDEAAADGYFRIKLANIYFIWVGSVNAQCFYGYRAAEKGDELRWVHTHGIHLNKCDSKCRKLCWFILKAEKTWREGSSAGFTRVEISDTGNCDACGSHQEWLLISTPAPFTQRNSTMWFR